MRGWKVGWVKLAEREEWTEWAVNPTGGCLNLTNIPHSLRVTRRKKANTCHLRERVRLVEWLHSERWIVVIRKWLQTRGMSDLIDFRITWLCGWGGFRIKMKAVRRAIDDPGEVKAHQLRATAVPLHTKLRVKKRAEADTWVRLIFVSSMCTLASLFGLCFWLDESLCV